MQRTAVDTTVHAAGARQARLFGNIPAFHLFLQCQSFCRTVKVSYLCTRNSKSPNNYQSLKRSKNIDEIYHVQSIENFEDEIVYASSITSINEIFNTKSTNEFKKKFIAHKELVKKLEDIDFSVELIWSRYSLNQDIKAFPNSGKKIKK